MQDGAEVTRHSADRAGSHGRRGSLGTRDASERGDGDTFCDRMREFGSS